jgi:transcriptional regulator with XRE-family HTH domain
MENKPRARRRANEVGPSGQRAARNLEQLREERRLNQDELAARAGRVGRPMTRQIVSKTEAADRRIDVDDLVALAIALGTTPNRLLLPGSAGEGELVALTPEVQVSALDAWKWATGEGPLPAGEALPGEQMLIGDDTERLFVRENQPHNVPGPYFRNVGHDMRKHKKLVRMIAAVVVEAKESGVQLGRLTRMVEEVDLWQLFGSLDETVARLTSEGEG